MPITKAVIAAAINENAVPWLIACACIAALWAGFRPDMVRDIDGRRLPGSVSARLTFIILFVLGYVAIAAVLLLLPSMIEKASASNSVITGMFGKLENAPIVAMLMIFSLYSLAPFREIERNALAWMHDTRHLRKDATALSNHLVECDFTVTPEEQRENVRSLEQYEVYITDGNTGGINLESVVTWRKTASLLRRVRAWVAEDPRVLSEEEKDGIDDIERAHGRKTRLAMDIIRMLERVREGGDLATALSTVTDILARASHGNRRDVAELEEQVQAELERPAKVNPIRLTSSELHDYLKKIEGYFLVEYRILLERISKLAAKSILHAGVQAPERLDELKALGFQGLGGIRPLTTNRILWMFLSVTVGGYLIYYVLWYREVLDRLQKKVGLVGDQLATQGRAFLVGIAVFVTSIALAAMIGALFGSNSANARAKETPWGRYLGAALIAAIAFFLMQGVRELVLFSVPGLLATPLTAEGAFNRIQLSAPWSVLPAMTALAVAWLARASLPASVVARLGARGSAIMERGIDGLALGALMVPSFAISIGLVELTGGKISPIFNSTFDPTIIGILCVVGFFVGSTVVREVRAAAHAQVVAPRAKKVFGASATANVVPWPDPTNAPTGTARANGRAEATSPTPA